MNKISNITWIVILTSSLVNIYAGGFVNIEQAPNKSYKVIMAPFAKSKVVLFGFKNSQSYSCKVSSVTVSSIKTVPDIYPTLKTQIKSNHLISIDTLPQQSAIHQVNVNLENKKSTTQNVEIECQNLSMVDIPRHAKVETSPLATKPQPLMQTKKEEKKHTPIEKKPSTSENPEIAHETKYNPLQDRSHIFKSRRTNSDPQLTAHHAKTIIASRGLAGKTATMPHIRTIDTNGDKSSQLKLYIDKATQALKGSKVDKEFFNEVSNFLLLTVGNNANNTRELTPLVVKLSDLVDELEKRVM